MITVTPKGKHAISPYLYMQFAEPLSNADASVDAAWDYVSNCWQDSALKIIAELAPPMIRWGGCFASYYHWWEAVGSRSERVPMINLTWEGIFANQVGTAEVVDLCRRVKAEPLFCVNMESDGRMNWAHPLPGIDRLGTAQEAAEWVAYCNDPDNRLRREHGAVEPYGVRYWQIGNETSYGYPEATFPHRWVKDGFDCSANIAVLKRFSEAMLKVDPSLKLIAWGDDNWAPQLCEEAGDKFDLVAFHYHYPYPADGSKGPLCGLDYRRDPSATWECMMNTYKGVEEKLAVMREQVSPYGKRLAMTEGHYILAGRNRGDALSTWTAGIAYARILNVFQRNADILDIATCADFFGNRWQVNAVMLPTPCWQGKPYLMPSGRVMSLFSHHAGKQTVPVSCSVDGVDVTAAMTGNRIYLHLVNTSRTSPARLPLKVEGRAIRSATAWEIATDPMQEIIEQTAMLIEPIERKIEDGIYTLPTAGVAAVEIELEP